jgi:HSP20 family protein
MTCTTQNIEHHTGKAAACAPGMKSVSFFRPAVDVVERESEYTIIAEVPGAAPEDIDLEFDRGMFTITARVKPRTGTPTGAMRCEYQVGDYRRAFRFDGSIDTEGARAACRDGVLTVTLPKTEAARRRRVRVSAV